LQRAILLLGSHVRDCREFPGVHGATGHCKGIVKQFATSLLSLFLGALLGCGSAMDAGAGALMDGEGSGSDAVWGDAGEGGTEDAILSVEIFAPTANWVLKTGDSVYFDGQVTGTPVLPTGLTVRWVSDRAGILWEDEPGPKGLVSHQWVDPDPGNHAVTLQVVSSAGDVVTATVEFFVNQPPNAPQVVIVPDNPTTTDPLRAVLVSPCRDPDGRVDVEYEWSWWHEGQAIPGETSPILSADWTTRGEVWSVRVIPSDDYHGGEAGAAEVTIANAVPSFTAAQIIPGTGGTITPFVCQGIGWIDADGDPEGAEMSWRINGVEHPAGPNGGIATELFERGDGLQCVVVPDDGLMKGEPVLSSEVEVANTPPTVGGVAIEPLEGNGATPLNCVVSDIVDPDGDPTSAVVTWLLNGMELPSTGDAPLTPMEFGGQHDDVITCRARAQDPDATGPPLDSAPLVLGNAPPMIALAEVNGVSLTGTATEESILGCQAWSAEDPDGDPVGLEWFWRINGDILLDGEGAPLNSETLTGEHFDKGDSVVCRVVATDDLGETTVLESVVPILVENTPPFITETSLTPSPATRNSVMECALMEWNDPDPADALALFNTVDPDDTAPPKVAVSWYVDDVVVAGEIEIYWTPSWVMPGSSVHCVLAPFDGQAIGLDAPSDPVMIVNTAPSIGAVLIGPNPAYANSLITCTPQGWVDAEGDSAAFLYIWRVNGEEVTSLGEDVLVGVPVSKGDVVTCEATPWDGVSAGPSVMSAPLALVNQPPSLSGVTLIPAEGTPDSVFTCLPKEVADADVEDEITFFYHWYRGDGQYMPEWTGDTLQGLLFSPGETFYCTVQPHDGEAFGQVYVSNSATVVNTPPTLDGVILVPLDATVETPLTCTPIGFNDADGDEPAYTVDWFVNSAQVTGQKGLVLPAGIAKKSQSVFCHLTFGDVYVVAGSIVSGTVALGNAAPTTPEIIVSPALALSGEALSCVLEGGAWDPDGDDVTWEATWLHDGEVVEEGPALSAGMTEGCGEWICVAVATDGEAAESAPGEAAAYVSPGKGLALDGNGAAVIASPTAISTAVAWTIEMWLHGGSGVALEFRDGQVGAGGPGYTLSVLPDGRPQCEFHALAGATAGLVQAEESLSAGGFHHVSVTWSGTTAELWLDGSLMDSQTFEWAPVITSDMVLGNSFVSSQSQGWVGTLDALHVSGGVLHDEPFFPGTPAQPGQDTLILYDFEEEGGYVVHDLAGNHDAVLTLDGAAFGPGWCLPPNELPSTPTVSLAPETPLPGMVLVCQGDALDPDGDALGYAYSWKRDGILMSAFTTNQIPADVTEACESWTCEVVASDGKGVSPTASASVQVDPDWNQGVMQGYSIGAAQLSFASFDAGHAAAFVPDLSEAYFPLVIETIHVNAHPIGGAKVHVWSVSAQDLQEPGTAVFSASIPPGDAGLQSVEVNVAFEDPGQRPRLGIEALLNSGLSVKLRDAGSGTQLHRDCQTAQPGWGCVGEGVWSAADAGTGLEDTHWEIHANFKTALGGFCQ